MGTAKRIGRKRDRTANGSDCVGSKSDLDRARRILRKRTGAVVSLGKVAAGINAANSQIGFAGAGEYHRLRGSVRAAGAGNLWREAQAAYRKAYLCDYHTRRKNTQHCQS